MLWLFVRPARVYLLGFFCSNSSVLFTVGSLSLLCLLFVSWFACSGGWCVGGLGVFHASRASVCLGPHLGWVWGWCTVKPVWALWWDILRIVPVRCFFCGIFVFFFCLVFSMHLYMRLFICALWSPAGKALTSWLSFVVSSCEFVLLFHWCPG